jgi:hypothetical protein
MDAPVNYRTLYEQQQKTLAELLTQKEAVEHRILIVRKHLQTLGEICENENIDIEISQEAAYLIQNTNLADEIRGILKSVWPGYLQPRVVKENLEALGRDLSKYQNPQATITMVLKRMSESGEVQEGTIPETGKKTYRVCAPNQWQQLGANLRKIADVEREVMREMAHGFNNVTPRLDTTKKK